MGPRRKAWLTGQNRTKAVRRKAQLGRRIVNGKLTPGCYAEYRDADTNRHRTKHFLTLAAAREWVRQHNARLDLREIGEVIPIPLREGAAELPRG